VDVVVHNVSPHMHLLGHDMQISVKFPDGKVQDLIRIDDWDFNWQYTYHFGEAHRHSQGIGRLSGFALRQLVDQPSEPQSPAQRGEVGRGDDRRDVHRIPGRDQERARISPSPAKRMTYIDILRKQQEQFREKYEKMRREAKAKDGKAKSADAGK